MNDQETELRLLRWFVSDNGGASSLTIASAFCDYSWLQDFIVIPSIPYDTGDFQRCLSLLELIPEWKDKLAKVSEKYPEWAPFVDNWERLTTLFGTPECQEAINECVDASEAIEEALP